MKNTQKTITILTIAMMLTLTITPVINSTQTRINNEPDDYNITINNCKYKDYTLIEALGYTVYEIKYTITIPKNNVFWDQATINLKTSEKTWTWKTENKIKPGYQTIMETHELTIRQENEKHLIGQEFTLELTDGTNTLTDDRAFMQYWKESDDYNITETQQMVTTTPHQEWFTDDDYVELENETTNETIEIFKTNKWFFHIDDPIYEKDPQATGAIPSFFLKSNRLGWLSEFAYHTIKVLYYLYYSIKTITNFIKSVYYSVARILLNVQWLYVVFTDWLCGISFSTDNVLWFILCVVI